MDRIISNCEQCANYRQSWDFRRDCVIAKREIDVNAGIPEWCPWPKAAALDKSEGGV